IGSLSIYYEEVALNKLLKGVTEDEIAVAHVRVFRKDKFKATDNKVEINLDAAKELAEKKEFRRAKSLSTDKKQMFYDFIGSFQKELDRRMEEQFTKIGALTARYGIFFVF
ncbi:hypothetical protein Tco_0054686, partial [Tanacetum coccineum]